MSNGLTTDLILSRLKQKVTFGNAKLLLDTAQAQTGIRIEGGTVLETEQARALCMTLINSGGPAFHVGQSIYKEYLS